MKISYPCYPCILNQVISLAELAGLEEEKAQTLMDRTLERILHRDPSVTTQHLVREVYDDRETLLPAGEALFDPYRQIKKESNRRVKAVIGSFREMVRQSRDPLSLALQGAAGGNIIDFGASAGKSIDIEGEIQRIPELTFGVDHRPALREKLEGAKTLLLIADNAGEILFDQILLEELRREFPRLRLVAAHREKPIINDAVAEDFAILDLPRGVEVISSGSVYPGTILEETSPEFRRLFDEADVILSKGQGNFETLWGEAPGRLFFILRVKCGQVARAVGADVGQVVLAESR